VVFTELTQSKIFSKKNDAFEFHIFFSFLASFVFVVLMTQELVQINSIFKKKREAYQHSGKNEELAKLKKLILRAPKSPKVLKKVKKYLTEGLRYSDQLLVEKFTEDISPHYVLLFDSVSFKFHILSFARIMIVQGLISSM